jgi:4a-hydroxytetrahydrobiopterin dehydratase
VAGSSPSREALSHEAVSTALGQLPGWTHTSDRLEKTFRFGGFREAMSFLVRIAFDAESLNHHPEIWNTYGTVRIGLTTHDADNRVSELDLELARRIDSIAWT